MPRPLSMLFICNRKSALLASLLSVVLICFFAGFVCAAGPKMGGRLVFGAENEFAGFDLLKVRGFAINDAIANNTIHERLFGLDDKGDIVPILGLSVSPSENGKVWIIKLRQKVVFHDGTPFDADAVVSHWQRILNPKNRYRGRSLIKPVQSVEKVDAHTVKFILKHRWLPFPKVLTGARGLGNFIPSPKAVEADTQKRTPVGTGPFMFKEWKSGDSFTVVKNPNYWQEGKPYLDEIVFRLVPDHQARYASLKSGQMDMVWMDRGNIIKKAEGDSSIVHYQNFGNGAEIFVLNTTKPPFDNPTVRRAVAHAWDQKQCVKVSYHDAIPYIEQPLGDDFPYKSFDYPTHDVKKARELLTDVPQPIEFECLHSDTKRGREQGELLQHFAKQIDISVKPVGLSFGPVIKKVVTKNYQMSTWRMPSGVDLGAGFYSAFHSKSRANVTGYNNPRMDALLTAQLTETDATKRQKILYDIVTLLNRDVPIIYRGGQGHHILAKSNVKGFTDFRNGIAQLADIWIDR